MLFIASENRQIQILLSKETHRYLADKIKNKKKKIIKLTFNQPKNNLKNMLLSRNNSNNVGGRNQLFYDSKTYFEKKLKIKDIKSFSNETEKNKEGYFSMREIKPKIKINKKFSFKWKKKKKKNIKKKI